jgi:erythromycin esterase-like protein
LAKKIGHRAIGVVYSAAAEASGRSYVPSILPERYDALIFIDRSSALRSLHNLAQARQLPETWPVGF